MRLIFASCLILIAFWFFAPPASAAVDLEVSLKTSSRGTISDPDEIETYRFEATAGTVLSVTVSGKGMDLEISLIDPGSSAVPIDLASGFSDRGSKVSLKKYTLESTGTWILRISSAEAGDYKLKLEGKPAKKIKDTYTVASSGSEALTVSAPAGSTVRLSARRASGSAAEPRFGDFDGSDRTEDGKSSTKSHAVEVEDVTGGDLPLVLKNVGGTGGDIKVTVKITAPKPAKLKLDVTDESLGDASGGATALSRRVDGATGGEVEIEDADSSIDGAMVKIDAGALAGNTTVSIASAPDLSPPQNRQLAGPTVEFGPAGLTFAAAVEITLPYDPALLPPDALAADLRVLHDKGTGTPETLVPTDVDEVNHLLTVETSSFSRFSPIAPKGAPNLVGRSYWGVFLDFRFEREGDDDSRERFVFSGQSVLTFGTPSARQLTATTQEEWSRWSHNSEDEGEYERSLREATGTIDWDYLPGGKAIRVSADEDFDFALGPQGDVLVSTKTTQEGLASLQLLIEKPTSAASIASLAGDFWVLQFGLEIGEDAGPLELRTSRTFGSITLSKDGTLADKMTERFCEFDSATGNVVCDKDSWSEADTTVRIAGPTYGAFEHALIISWVEDGKTREFLAFPSADGNILVAVDGPDMVVAVRKGSGMSPGSVAGDFQIRGIDLEQRPYDGTGRTLGDIEVQTVDGEATIGSKGTLSFSTEVRSIRRDPTVAGGLLISTDDDSGSTKISIGKKGDILIDSGGDDTVGALTPDGTFGFFHDSPNTDHGIVGIIFVLANP
jgi:Bacterial pre-peptidase C-terminal domain